MLRVAIAELAIVRVAGDVEVDIAVGRVGKPPVNQSLDHGDDVADVLRGPRHVVDAGDVEPLEIADIVLRHPVGQLFHGRVLLAGLDDQLVVDISDIDNESHRVTEVGQVALDGVEDDRSDHVADVARFVDRRPANVH